MTRQTLKTKPASTHKSGRLLKPFPQTEGIAKMEVRVISATDSRVVIQISHWKNQKTIALKPGEEIRLPDGTMFSFEGSDAALYSSGPFNAKNRPKRF
ncbi:MAG: hypothetical protein Q7S22_00865 [Candidatus Micrarchaeota archaeon]|nr:hypothetical protein [Candidatus Micrarchaeota archaeon]